MRRAATLVLSLMAATAYAQSSETELKEGFRARLPAVEKLKDAGKIGETSDGALAALDPRYLAETVSLQGGKRISVADLIAAENRDRTGLYRLIAERTGETPEDVAKQNAIRNYREAKPEHYLRTKAGQWLQKKSLSGGAGS
jgi:uncharacterized protein YdbL (DUF1318 family)